MGDWCEAEVTEGYVVKDKSALVTVWNLISKKKENRDRRMEKGDRKKERRKKTRKGEKEWREWKKKEQKKEVYFTFISKEHCILIT